MEAREVALLLTDVEASTRLLVRHGGLGVDALARVGEVVSMAAADHGGQVSTAQGEGDSAVVLFETVARAVAAALDVNERMANEHWPADERVVVRSAVHVGEVMAADDGVFGLEVHRCARMRALAAGGEVVLSDAAARGIGQLPTGSSIADEGLIVLRGFVQPDRVWRLVDPRLSPRLRPIIAAGALAGELPVWGTPLIGRSDDVALVVARICPGAVMTVTGPAGVGKTRLAVAAASQASLRACFVDLTQAVNDKDVSAVAAKAFGVETATSALSGIEEVLVAAPALVVLDNCEHVLDAAAELVGRISSRCSGSAVLATSRAALRVPGEEVITLAPLPTSPGGAATQLFVDRARAVRPDVMADGASLVEMDAVAALLEGVPLAIELAAARVSAFSLGEILELLERDLGDLGDARRRGPDRQRTLRAAIDWSILLLTAEERAVLSRLAVLPGSFRLATAQAVTGHAAGALPTLVEQSLVATEHTTGPTRYRLLEMVRAVAQQALSTRERTDVLDRLLVHCVDELTRLDMQALPPTGLKVEIARDHALQLAAIEHALASGQTELGLELVHNLFPAWLGVTQRSLLDRWMDAFVARCVGPSRLRCMVLRRQAIIAFEQLGDHERASRLLDAAEADALIISDPQLLGRVLATRAAADIDRGHLVGIDDMLRSAITLLEEAGDIYVANAMALLADVHSLRGEFDVAYDVLVRAEAAGPSWFERIHIGVKRGWCELLMGRIDAAARSAGTVLDLAETSGNPDLISHAVEIAAVAAMARGDTDVANELLVRARTLCREHELAGLADGLAWSAVVSVLRGDLADARRHRDELRAGHHGTAESLPYRRLTCALVDLDDGDAVSAAATATEVGDDAQQLGQPYLHVLATELLAACIAVNDPGEASRLLAAANDERTAIGAPEWPLEPYRCVTCRVLEEPR